MKTEKEIKDRVDELEEFYLQEGETLKPIERFEIETIIGTLKYVLE